MSINYSLSTAVYDTTTKTVVYTWIYNTGTELQEFTGTEQELQTFLATLS